jgi:LPPG:FO 2-phospho-L-lactate transferase
MPEQSALATTAYNPNRKVVVLVGGVGGARMADGFAQIMAPENLTIIVNTGDDFQHMGLTICPDLDTVMYTLAAVANTATGWGRNDESWRVMDELAALGGPVWFRLGDRDLATHLTRTHLLAQGEKLTAVTRRLCRQLGTAVTVLPMSDQPAPTLLATEEGILPFQEWFVGRQWQPAVREVLLPEDVRAPAAVLAALEEAELVVLAPSNPFVSIDPILNVYPIRAMIADVPEAIIAVSPIVGGAALKGPAAKMLQEWGLPVSPQAISDHYGDLIDLFVYDQQDKGRIQAGEHELLCTDTIMSDRAARARLAAEILAFTEERTEA